MHLDREEWQAAIDDYDVLIAANNFDPGLVTRRAEALMELGQWDTAAAEYLTLVDQTPDRRDCWSERSKLLLQLAGNEQLYSRLIDARPDDPHLHVVLARQHGLHDRWDEAAEAFRPVGSTSQPWFEQWFEIACALRLSGDDDGYAELLERITQSHGETDNPWVTFALGRIHGLTAQPQSVADQAVTWARSALEVEQTPWRLHVMGLTLFRAGRLDEATRFLEESNASNWSEAGHTQNRLVLAMIDHQRGEAESARNRLTRVDEWIATQQVRPERTTGVSSIDWFAVQALRRAAEELIHPDSPQSLED